jgi:hypothetical protein
VSALTRWPWFAGRGLGVGRHPGPGRDRLVLLIEPSPAPPGPAWAATLSLQLPDGTPVSPNQPVPSDAVTVINPAAMPAGTELFFGYFDSNSTLTGNLIYTSSYTCSSNPPAGSAHGPTGSGRS